MFFVCTLPRRPAGIPHLRGAAPEQTEPNVAAYARATQTDHKARTPWTVHDGPSRFNPSTGKYELRHTQADHATGTRGFFVPTLEATKYHQDVQVEGEGQSNYAAYMAKYSSKFSDSFYEELLNDDADANSVAASVLLRYHPCVPEMALQLFGSLLHQWHVTTWSRGRKDFLVPVPDEPSLRAEVRNYMASAWRSEDMCLL